MKSSADFLLGAPKSKKNEKKAPAPVAWKDRISHEDYESLRDTFIIFDEDHSGTIDPSQIHKVFEELELHHRNEFITKILNAIRDKNKPINFDEFVDCVCSNTGEFRTKDGLQRIFNHYDREQEGVIGFEQLKEISRTIGENLDDDALMELMHSTFIMHHTGSNEKFTFEEFYSVISGYYAKQ